MRKKILSMTTCGVVAVLADAGLGCTGGLTGACETGVGAGLLVLAAGGSALGVAAVGVLGGAAVVAVDAGAAEATFASSARFLMSRGDSGPGLLETFPLLFTCTRQVWEAEECNAVSLLANP